MNSVGSSAMKTFRIGFPQFLIGLLTVVAIAGFVALVLKITHVF